MGFRTIAGAFTLVLLLASCGGDPQLRWQRYTSEDGAVSVEFPGVPKASTEKAFTTFAETPVQLARLSLGATGMLQLAHYELLPAAVAAPSSSLRVECFYPMTDSAFTPGEARDIPIAGQQGLAVSGTAPKSDSLPNGGWEEDRCVIIDGRMYHLIAVVADTPTARKIALRFLDSFQAESAAE